METILCPEIDFDPKDAAATIPAGDKPLVVSIEAMVAQLILRRAMLRIACLERDIPPLDLRFYGGAVLIAGIVAAKALSDLGAIHLLALSALSLTVWLIADRRTLSEAIYAVKPRIVSARISEP